MSIYNFFSPQKRTQPVEEPNPIPSKHTRYEVKRTRRFQEHWKKSFPWASFDNEQGRMFCKVCRDNPLSADGSCLLFIGTTNIRIDPLKTHEKNKGHIACMLRSSKAPPVAETIIGKAIAETRISPEARRRLQFLFNTAYGVAKKGKPFSDFEYICEIQHKNCVELGENYCNRQKCQEFVVCIANVLRDGIKQEIAKANFLSLLSDGSTDASILEQELVYLRYLSPRDCRPVTRLVDIVALESGNAAGVFKGIEKGLEKMSLDFEKLSPSDSEHPSLICCNFDGASVMLGNKTGVATKIKELIPSVVVLHCIAHKLELAVLDANKSCNYMSDFEETLKGIFHFYHYSPKRRRELTEINSVLENDLSHFSGVKQVRWLASKERAVSALKKNLEVVAVHLEHRGVDGRRADDGGKAKGYLKGISTVRFLKFLHFLPDFLKVVSGISKAFQQEDLLIIEIPDKLERAVIELSALKNNPGKCMKEFVDNLKVEEKAFKSLKLKGNQQSFTSFAQDTEIHSLIDSTICYIGQRFQNLQEKPLSLFSIFNFHNWPLRSQELGQFGNAEIQELTTQLFSEYFTSEDLDEMTSEWIELKLVVRPLRASPLVDVYSQLLQRLPADLQHILKVVEFMLVISPSTASCERGFSAMNVLKNKYRTLLSQESLQAQLTVMKEGCEISSFNPDPSIDAWFLFGPGTKHVEGHKLPSAGQLSN